MSPLDREALRAHDALQSIQATRIDVIVPRIASTAAVAGATLLAAVHLCRWLVP